MGTFVGNYSEAWSIYMYSHPCARVQGREGPWTIHVVRNRILQKRPFPSTETRVVNRVGLSLPGSTSYASESRAEVWVPPGIVEGMPRQGIAGRCAITHLIATGRNECSFTLHRSLPLRQFEQPTAYPTYCRHSDSDRGRAERRLTLRGRPQALRRRHRSSACASLAFLVSRRSRLRSRSRIARSPPSQSGHQSSPVSPRFRTTYCLREPSPPVFASPANTITAPA